MISGSLLVAFMAFSAVALFTPGPNNAMLMASGLNYGSAVPSRIFLASISALPFWCSPSASDSARSSNAYPWLHTALKYIGAAYLLYLAYAIATSGPPDAAKAASGKPLTFLRRGGIPVGQVKGLATAVGAVTTYAGIAPFPWNVLLMSGIFLRDRLRLVLDLGAVRHRAAAADQLAAVPCASSMSSMALALVASLYPVLVEP